MVIANDCALFTNFVTYLFYFIGAKGADEGKYLMNGTTPDGHRVGADGAWIEE